MSYFPFYAQPDAMDCGPTCLRMIAKHYGRSISLQKLRSLSETTRQGSSLRTVSTAAEKIGFRTLGVKIGWEKLAQEAPLPCIVFWRQEHFVVVYKIKNGQIFVADPAHGLLTYTIEEFIQGWIGNNANRQTKDGVTLLLTPTPRLHQTEEDDLPPKQGFAFLFSYLWQYKTFITQLFIGLLVISLLQLIAPLLTQSMMDIGIQHENIHFIYLILIAQTLLFVGKTSIQIIQSWLLLHISSRINVALISDFFIKLMALPISFFDIKMTGDIMQRINDHDRIRKLLTTTSLNVLFSLVQLLILTPLLAWYSLQLFTVYIVGSLLYIVWILCFLKKRKDLDYKNFSQVSKEKSKVIELINGMQEIKLHNAEQQKRWDWEYLQASMFRLHTKSLSLEQIEGVGANVIHELQNILITILSARLVIQGNITLGMMMGVTYVIGQLNGPVGPLINLIYALQDTSIALERLSEIHNKEDEELEKMEVTDNLPNTGCDLTLKSVSFRYKGKSVPTLDNLNLTIPANKLTAIVGVSGSGKTTLMKLLLKFYKADRGEIKMGSCNLNHVTHKNWRSHCGVVMQEGYLFNDTIAHNIAIGEEIVDQDKLLYAVEIAHIKQFIESLPLTYNTKVGMEGVGISTGEKQRLLIARAVYKNPSYLFFDEATSALDAHNEFQIMESLNKFFKGRTTIVIAHRLSTVKQADQIVVLGEGSILEKGTHQSLLDKQGSYYHLVSNQLALEKLHQA